MERTVLVRLMSSVQGSADVKDAGKWLSVETCRRKHQLNAEDGCEKGAEC